MTSDTPKGLPRWVDMGIATVALSLSAPAIVVAALVIKITSRGPVLFRQTRVGAVGRPFQLVKLRSMSVSNEGSLITARGDRRVTGIGQVLRKFKIDELPQFWNVLQGDMSVVGPRPEVPALVDLSDPSWRRILAVRPGITDPVTIRLRDEELLLAEAAKSGFETGDFYRTYLLPWKKRGYTAYVSRRSAAVDLRILVETFWALWRPPAPPSLREVMEDADHLV